MPLFITAHISVSLLCDVCGLELKASGTNGAVCPSCGIKIRMLTQEQKPLAPMHPGNLDKRMPLLKPKKLMVS